VAGGAEDFGQWIQVDGAVLEAQTKLCRAVLDRLDATPAELAAVLQVLNDVKNRLAGLLVDTSADSGRAEGPDNRLSRNRWSIVAADNRLVNPFGEC